MNNPDTPPSPRGMASVAQYFLSRQSSRRVSPEDAQQADSSATQSSPAPSGFASQCVSPISCPTDSLSPREIPMNSLPDRENRISPATIALIADHLPDSAIHLHAYARQLSFHNGPAGLICLDESHSQWINFNHEDSPAPLRESPQNPSECSQPEELRFLLGEQTSETDSSYSSDPTQGSFLSDLAGRSETLLVAPAHRQLGGMREILSLCKTAVVFCRSDSESLIDAYQAVKWLINEMDYSGDISLFVCDGNPENIDDIHRRLAQTAEQFLHIDIPFAEYPQPCEVPMSQQNLPPNLSLDLTSRLINLLQAEMNPSNTPPDEYPGDSAPDRSHSIPHPVTPPADSLENRSAETPSSFENSHDAPAPRTQNPASAKPAPSLPAPLRPIPVEEFPRTESQVIDLLQMRVPMWLRHTGPSLALPLHLPKPYDSSFRVLLDSQGRAYLLAVNILGDPGCLSAALHARQWIKDNLLQNMRHFHQLNLSQNLEPGMILVIADSTLCKQARQRADSIAQFPCHVLQLHFLQTETENFILLA